MTDQVNDPYRDLIIKWKDELHRQDDEIKRLRAQRDELLAALKPFADLARQIERDHLGWYHEHFQFIDPPIEMRWLIMARAAISAVEDQQGEQIGGGPGG